MAYGRQTTCVKDTAGDTAGSIRRTLLRRNAVNFDDFSKEVLAAVERKLRNLLQVAAAGDGAPESLLTAIREHETQVRGLKAQLNERAAVEGAATDELALRRHVERVMSEWRHRLEDVAVARRALRTLLAGGTFTAKVVERGDGERVYAVEGKTVVGALLRPQNTATR